MSTSATVDAFIGRCKDKYGVEKYVICDELKRNAVCSQAEHTGELRASMVALLTDKRGRSAGALACFELLCTTRLRQMVL